MKKQPAATEQTRANLRAAFWSLYKEKPTGKITVREITDRAGYNRATVFLTSSRRSDPRLSSFDVAMGSGMANLQYASCLDNLNHTEAGRALPSIWTLFRCQSAQNIVRYRAKHT